MMVPEAESVVMPASKSENDWSLRFVPFGSGPCTRTSTAERDAVAMSILMCFFGACSCETEAQTALRALSTPLASQVPCSLGRFGRPFA